MAMLGIIANTTFRTIQAKKLAKKSAVFTVK